MHGTANHRGRSGLRVGGAPWMRAVQLHLTGLEHHSTKSRGLNEANIYLQYLSVTHLRPCRCQQAQLR